MRREEQAEEMRIKKKKTKGEALSSVRIITFILERENRMGMNHDWLWLSEIPLRVGGEGVIATNMSARITVQVQVTTSVAVLLVSLSTTGPIDTDSDAPAPATATATRRARATG